MLPYVLVTFWSVGQIPYLHSLNGERFVFLSFQSIVRGFKTDRSGVEEGPSGGAARCGGVGSRERGQSQVGDEPFRPPAASPVPASADQEQALITQL